MDMSAAKAALRFRTRSTVCSTDGAIRFCAGSEAIPFFLHRQSDFHQAHKQIPDAIC